MPVAMPKAPPAAPTVIACTHRTGLEKLSVANRPKICGVVRSSCYESCYIATLLWFELLLPPNRSRLHYTRPLRIENCLAAPKLSAIWVIELSSS